ncbi:hypothetical protein CJ226_14235 [Microbacterium sp. UMB0228]|uniref:hypothetical protein n=1 Tax=Microbacterium sp. UMB0228 TaxID=2029109 RepID=UPI000C7FFF8D|nr:hypothetical protein [Microbacterium sp. UMB0228]PMC02549.1 hypothetical protein CJ226_14235 [Microbacterium sp. UMB0228]
MAGFAVAMAFVFLAFAQGSVSTTTAAWTDRTVVTATVTSASAWLSPFAGNTCKAYSSPSASPTSCAITAIRYEEINGTSGHFYISTNAPGGSHHVDVDVDLKKATGLPRTWTSWAAAGVLPGSHVTPDPAWMCSSLPRLTGRSLDWHLTDLQVAVTLQRTTANTICT